MLHMRLELTTYKNSAWH